jgi:hypothetical protein
MIEPTSSVCKPVEVSTVYNRRRAITVLLPKTTHPAYEPLTPKVAATKQQEDEIPITYLVYYSKISELADRAVVSNCQRFGTPDSKIKHTKNGLSLSLSSLDSSLNQESSVDEDELPIDDLVYTINRSSPCKRTRKKFLLSVIGKIGC